MQQAPPQKSIPAILGMLANVDLDLNLGRATNMPINKMYQVLTGDLGMDISVGELKALNKYLMNK